MTYEKIVTLYDTSDHAEAARRNLLSAGFPAGEISMINSKSLGIVGEKLREPGLWHRLFGRDILEHEAIIYGRSVEAGGSVLTVRVPETDVARAKSILNAYQSVDLIKRAEEHGLLTTESATKATTTAPAVATLPKSATTGTGARPTVAGEEVLALAEEEIKVGKRLVQEGTTRIRRFITEKPVEAQVTLHEEHARIIRRAISDPNDLKNIDWNDRTIEITETVEEPVVTKTAHIAEEVVIQREGRDHMETVRDKVRRQQVEVDRIETERTAVNK
jgi:stress response protein YsnF